MLSSELLRKHEKIVDTTEIYSSYRHFMGIHLYKEPFSKVDSPVMLLQLLRLLVLSCSSILGVMDLRILSETPWIPGTEPPILQVSEIETLLLFIPPRCGHACGQADHILPVAMQGEDGFRSTFGKKVVPFNRNLPVINVLPLRGGTHFSFGLQTSSHTSQSLIFSFKYKKE